MSDKPKTFTQLMKSTTKAKTFTTRPNYRERGYNARWDRAKKRFMRAHPLCAECLRYGRTTAGYCVDHIKPHRGDMNLFWDVTNWQTMCRSCHAVKSAQERETGRGDQSL